MDGKNSPMKIEQILEARKALERLAVYSRMKDKQVAHDYTLVDWVLEWAEKQVGE